MKYCKLFIDVSIVSFFALVTFLVITIGCKPKLDSDPTLITGAYTFPDGSVVYSLSDGKVVPVTSEEMQKIKDGIERVENPKIQARELDELIKETEMLRDRARVVLRQTTTEFTEVLNEIKPEHTKNVSEINSRLTEISDLLTKSEVAEKSLREAADILQARAREFTEAKAAVYAIEANMSVISPIWDNVTILEKNLRLTRSSLDDLGSLLDQSTAQWNEQIDRFNVLIEHVDLQRQAQSELLVQVGEIDKSNTELEDHIAELQRKNEQLSENLESVRRQNQEIKAPAVMPKSLSPLPPQRKYTHYNGYVAPATSAPATSAPVPDDNSSAFTPSQLSGIARSKAQFERWGLSGLGLLFEDTPSGVRISIHGTLDARYFISSCRTQKGDPSCLDKCMRLLHANDMFIVSCLPVDDSNKVFLTVTPTKNGHEQKVAELTHMLGHVITTLKSNF